jgi:hypothetical protein
MAIQTGQRTSRSSSSKPKKAKPRKKAAAKKKTKKAAPDSGPKKGDEFLATGASPTGQLFKVKSVSKDGGVVLVSGDQTLFTSVGLLESSESWVAV